jgi:hypothetical protein
MEVTVSISAKKRRIASRLIFKRMLRGSRLLFLLRFVSFLLGGSIGATGVLLIEVLKHVPSRLGILFTGSMALILIFMVLYKYCMRCIIALQFRPNGYINTPVHYVIEEDTLLATMHNTIIRHGWADFEEVELRKDHILVYLDRGLGLYMKREDFASVEAFEAFYSALKAKITTPTRLRPEQSL